MSVHTVNSNSIQVTAKHITEQEVWAEVAERYGIREISDSTAVTIASWFASPGAIGGALASLSTGARTNIGALLDDIAATRQAEHKYLSSDTHRALDLLATWAISKRGA